MTLFCWKTKKGNMESVFKHVFERLDVDFSIDDHDSCVILKNPNEKNMVLKRCDYLTSNYGFPNVKQIRRWSTIKHVGPYYSEHNHRFYNSYFLDNGKKIVLSPDQEEIAFIYISCVLENNIVDSVFNDNFWNDFQKLTPTVSKNFTAINWDNVKQNYTAMMKEPAYSLYEEKIKHRLVEIDGVEFACTPFVLERYKLVLTGNDRGKIIRKIELSDVTLNLSESYVATLPNREKFKNIIYKKDVTWAATWTEPVTLKKKYMSILFNTIERYDESDDDNERPTRTKDEDSDVSSIAGYDDDEENITDDDTDDNDDEVIIDFEPMIKNKYLKKKVADYSTSINFDTLDEEYKLLPLVYIVSVFDQWEILLRACSTQFTDVSNLNKVSDSLLKLVADAAKINKKKKKFKNINTNMAFIEYANKRNV